MDLLTTVEGFLAAAMGQALAAQRTRLAAVTHITHTHTQGRLCISVPRSPLMWPRQPRDKWAQTWKTLRLAKNNMLSTDQLSRNANTKCSLCCNYLHFDMSGGGDSFLYSPVNAAFTGSRGCRDALWLHVAVLAPGSTSTKYDLC